MNPRIITVTALNNYIKRILDSDIVLMNTNVEGEVSNLVHNRSGHLYFSLKDSESRVDCVMFKGDVMKMDKIPVDGDTVTVKGRISFYPRDGKCQLYANSMQLKGMGDLFVRFNELKEKLFKEGLFDTEKKRPLPVKPEKIAVITSPTGAAIRDVINVTKRRNKGQCLIIYPVKVQGEGATEEVIEALERVNKRDDIDLIIIARGGGSIEDLWAFNSEKLAYALRASKVPVVSGIGHEIDTTITDLAADFRAATPSQAAELAVPVIEDQVEAVIQARRRIISLMKERFNSIRNSFNITQRFLSSKNPKFLLVNEGERLMRLNDRMEKSLSSAIRNNKNSLDSMNIKLSKHNPENVIKLNKEKALRLREDIERIIFTKMNESYKNIEAATDLLNAYSPKSILNKGYAIVQDENDKVLMSTSEVLENKILKITVKDGSCVIKKES